MGPIIIATDFSPQADRAYLRAILMARHGGQPLLFAHALGPADDSPATAQRKADAEGHMAALCAAASAQHHVRASWAVLDGAPEHALPALADETGASLLIVGPHDPEPFRDLLLGQLGEKLLARMACPLLFANGMAVAPYRRALIATDLSDGARRSFAQAAPLLRGQDPEIILFHAFDPRPFGGIAASAGPRTLAEQDRAALKAAKRESLSTWAAGLGMVPARIIAEPMTRSAATMILTTAEEADADLLVAGTEGKSHAKRWLLGSVAEELLRDATRDLMLIPSAAS